MLSNDCFLRLKLLIASFLFFCCTIVQPVNSAEPAATAPEMMQAAHDGRGEWTNFPGFTAKITVRADGESANGTLTVARDGSIELQLPQSENFPWVKRALDSLVGHRTSSGEAVTNVEFADSQLTHPHGRLIRSVDPSEKSLWRVKDDLLTEVHRFSPDSRFTISVGDVWRNKENKHLPKNFVVTTWEVPSGQIKSVRQINNDWTRIGDLDLPVRHLAITNRSDGTTVTHQIDFSDYQVAVATVQAP